MKSYFDDPSPQLAVISFFLGLALPVASLVSLADHPKAITEEAVTAGSIAGAWVTYVIGKATVRRWPGQAQVCRNGRPFLLAAFAAGVVWSAISLLLAFAVTATL